MSTLSKHAVLIVLVTSTVFFANLGQVKLWDRDEPRNAGCAREMLERNDWVTPVFNAELRIQKPVLLYWLIMTAYSVFGVNEFAARFWSATLGMGTVLCTYVIGRRLFSANVAFWSAVILATTIMFDVASRAATPDASLIFFSTLAMTFYVLGTFRPKQEASQPLELKRAGRFFPQHYGWIFGVYAAMAIAVLAKGPVGLILPTAVIGMFLLIVRLPTQQDTPHAPTLAQRALRCGWAALRPFAPGHFFRTCWVMRPFTAIGLTLLIASPWYIWVGLRTNWQWPLSFFLTENVARATSSMESHGGSIFFYPLALLVGFFPWSVFAGPVISDVIARLRRGDRHTIALVLLACWVIVWVAAFTIATTKLPSYVTPTYPAIALLTSFVLGQWLGKTTLASRWWWRAALASAALAGVAAMVVLPLVTRELFPGEQWLGALGLFPLMAGVVALILHERQQTERALRVYATGAVFFCVSLFGLALCTVDKHQRAGELLAELRRSGEDVRLGSYGCLEPTWVFYGEQPIAELLLESSADLLPRRDARGAQKSGETLRQFFATQSPRLLVTTHAQYDAIASRLPKEIVVLREVPYFLKKERLVVLGNAAHRRIARQAPRRSLR